MAEAIGEGIREAGKEAEVVFVTGANLDELKAAPKFALGCPAMGAEVLEESEMEPFVCDVEGFGFLAKRSHCSVPMAGETVSG